MRLNEDEIESWAVRISYWPYAPHLLLEGEKKKKGMFSAETKMVLLMVYQWLLWFINMVFARIPLTCLVLIWY